MCVVDFKRHEGTLLSNLQHKLMIINTYHMNMYSTRILVDTVTVRNLNGMFILIDEMFLFITKTRPCNIQRFLKLSKMKIFNRKILIFFLFLLQNIDCGYPLEPPRRGSSNEYPQSMFWRRF